jgi:hypothetical protein
LRGKLCRFVRLLVGPLDRCGSRDLRVAKLKFRYR